MNSSKEKISSPCIQCEQYKKEIEDKNAKIKILENNILKIKSLLSESGSLIDGYNEIMEENKNLKEEIENLKNNINILNNNNYHFELLKQKMLRYQKENEELKAGKQFYESQKKQNINIKDSNETKIKRELSQKDKEINQLNTVISLLKLQNNEQKLSNEEIIKKYSKTIKNNNNNNNNSMLDDDELLFTENDNNNNNLNKNIYYGTNSYNNAIDYRNNNYNNKINDVKIIDLCKEKEFLSDEYQRYKQKYLVYKFKYHEFKKTTKLFLNYMKVLPSGFNFTNFCENLNEKKSINLLGAKRLKTKSKSNYDYDKEDLKSIENNMNVIRNININNQTRKKSEDMNIFKMPSLFNNTFIDNDNEDSKEENVKLIESEKEKEEKEKKKCKNKSKSKNLKKKNNIKKKIIEIK